MPFGRGIFSSGARPAEKAPAVAEVKGIDDLDLSHMSGEEMRDTLMVLAGDLDDLHQLVTPLKVENARLAQCGKHLSGLVQEVVHALRDFFADKARREWYKSQEEGDPLQEFFRSLIRWYQRICDDDNPTLAFYKRVWEYERGADDPIVALEGNTAKSRKAEPEAAQKKASGRPGPTSSNLYDACLARSETTLFRESVDKLQRENASLRKQVTALENEVRAFKGAGGSGQGGRAGPATKSADTSRSASEKPPGGAPKEAAPGGGDATPRKPRSGAQASLASPPAGKTLGQMAADDPKWKRLLEDSDQLFSEQDIINETYEEYLGDILVLMERHGCSFRRGIELSAEAAASSAAAAAPDGGEGGGGVAKRDLMADTT